jgi:hypothetical protein
MEKKQRIFETRHCELAPGEYSLTIAINNCHISMDTFCYPHREGNYVDFTIFRLTSEDVRELIEKLQKDLSLIEPSPKSIFLSGYCKRCGWKGSNFACIRVLNPWCPDDVITEMGCPNCKSDKWLTIKTEGLDK